MERNRGGHIGDTHGTFGHHTYARICGVISKFATIVQDIIASDEGNTTPKLSMAASRRVPSANQVEEARKAESILAQFDTGRTPALHPVAR